MTELLLSEELPDGFVYPALFVRVVELGLTRLEPWWVLDGESLRARLVGMRQRYPTRQLVPFAARQDRDDVACWDGEPERVVIIHDFASPGWEFVREFDNFGEWLRSAIDDLIDFEP